MTSYHPGDVILVAFPFVQGGASKLRPALVVADTGDDDVVLALVTTHGARSIFDIRLADWSGAGLLAPSVVRLNKLATLEKSLVSRQLGNLTEADHKSVAGVLTKLFVNW